MQTSYLQYLVEIDRTRSITQAAANLYLTQPNLSRILHEVESQLGFTIFERSNRGVTPTVEGMAFLQHARRILNEMEAIEGLGDKKRAPDRFHICMPRSASMLGLASEYLNALPRDRALDAMLRECNVRRAFDFIASGEIDLGIIRFRSEYRDYFEDRALEQSLSFEPLNSYRYRVIMRSDNPLADKHPLREADLAQLTEITHGATFRAKRTQGHGCGRSVYSVDRHAQLTLVRLLPNAFIWATAIPPEYLEPWGLAQREVEDNRVTYRNALIAIAPEDLNDIERDFMDLVRRRCAEDSVSTIS